ncbi:hypothetical protein [Paraclostridium dentum]|uniref:hypothetical protein n=1 Tax=Paraclostridium dentum TaxID=2662455 RepID=UPI003F3D445C
MMGDNNKSLFVWDLETTGATNLEGIWNPDSITEFAMQEYNLGTKALNKTTIAVGLDKNGHETYEKAGQAIIDEISEAISKGTLQSNERLRVSAIRYSLYGDDAVTFSKVDGKGYYKFDNFIDADKHRMNDIEAIKKGVNKFVKIANETELIDGIRADHYHMATAMNKALEATRKDAGMLAGQNDNLFDWPIFNNQLLKMQNLYGDKGKDIFNFNTDIKSDQSIDFLGGLKLFSEYFNSNELYGGVDISDVKKLRGQEFLVQKHYKNWFKREQLKPHLAEDDVTALLAMFTEDSEILKGKSLLKHIGEKLNTVKSQNNTLEVGTHILQAKKRAGFYQGKGFLNFAKSKSKDTVYTADNYLIGGKDQVSSQLGVTKEGFSAGFGLNKGAFYNIEGINSYELTDELRSVIGDLSPEFSTKNLYHVQLGMMVDDNYKNTRLDDLTQNFFFKSEKEMNAFLSGTFDVVAKHTEDGMKILDGHLDKFDIRELNNIKGRTVFQDVNANHSKSEQDLIQSAVERHNKKLLTSRAENSILQDNSYKNITKAKELKARLKDQLDIDIKKQRDINNIMAGKVANGQMPLNLDEERLKQAQNIIFNSLSYDKKTSDGKIQRLLDSSIDNYSSIMEYMDDNQKLIDTVLTELEPHFGGANSKYSPETKQYLFNKVMRELKEDVASKVYNGSDETIAKMVLGDKKLQASLNEFKNTYEIDFKNLIKQDKINFIDMSHPEEFAELLKIDISNSSSSYTIRDKATKAIFGDNYKDVSSKHHSVAVEKLFSYLKDDKALWNSKEFVDIRKSYGYEKGAFTKAINADDVSERIIKGMRQVKSKDATVGIVNTKRAFMKSIESHSGFTAALNSDKVLDMIPGLVNNIVKDTNVQAYKKMEMTNAESIVENMLMKHYMPSKDLVKTGANWNENMDILYTNAAKDIKKYLSDIVYSASNLGADIHIQDDGALLLSKNGRLEILDNLPKVRFDQDSGVMYTEMGSMKMQLNNVLDFKYSNKNIKGNVKSSLGTLNDFTNSNYVQSVANKQGTDAGLDRLLSSIRTDMKVIREGATINGFGGNDIDSNFNVDTMNIKNVLFELFGVGEQNSHILDTTNLIDKNVKDTIREKLERIKSGKIEDLSPDMGRDLIKNMQHILDAIADKGNVSDDFVKLIEDISFTGQEKKVTNMIGYSNKGHRPTNSVFGVFDNTQRPPITQSGNAMLLRVNDIDNIKLGKTRILAGNLISSASMDNKLMRDVAGVGLATTDVMMDVSYVNSNALQVLMDTNFKKVISQKAEDAANDSTERAYKYIRNSLSTFEQERIMNSRAHEAAFGLRTANTQKLSKNLDIAKPMREMNLNQATEFKELLLNHRGDFKIVNGEIDFTSSVGTYLKRGEAILKTSGFAGMDTPFSSKMSDGVFNFNFYKSDGTKLKDKEISKIINQNKSMFMKDNQLLNKEEMINTLENLLANKYSAKGQYAIEDIAALGYAKTMTGGAEKGMTDIVYATTGKYDPKVKKVFQDLNVWDSVNSKVLTNEGVDAILKHGATNTNHLNMILKEAGFNSVNDLKSAMANERHKHSDLLFKDILGGKTNVLANDNIIGHENIGQMYQGTLSKVIETLNRKGHNGAEMVAELMQQKDYQFIENYDLSKSVGKNSGKGIKVSHSNGKLIIDGDFLTDINNVSSLNSKKFESMIYALDKKVGEGTLTTTAYEYINEKGELSQKEITKVGSYLTEVINGKKTFIGTNTFENNKYVRDAETQTGITAEYLELKNEVRESKKQKTLLNARLNTSKDAKERSALKKQIDDIDAVIDGFESNIRSYEGSVKPMKVGDQELSILDRVAITDSHATFIKDLMDDDSSEVLTADSLRGRFFKYEGDMIPDNRLFKVGADGKYEGTRILSGFTGRMKASL